MTDMIRTTSIPAAGPIVEGGSSWLEIRQPGRPGRTLRLEGDLTIGRHLLESVGHVTLIGDETVSRFHVSIFRRIHLWCIADLGTRNGSFVNGERLDGGERPLRADDDIRIGERTQLIFRSLEASALDRCVTGVALPVPDLTAAERRCLLALCRPLLDGDLFTEAARVIEIGDQLCITESAVKQMLGRLYLKFDIVEDHHGRSRRGRLANEALARGVVRRSDLDAGA